MITSDAEARISACGTYRTTRVLAPAFTDAGSIDGPVVTMARTGNCATASTHRCSRSACPCSLVLRLTRTSGVDPSRTSTSSISRDSGGASSTGPMRSTLAASGTSGSNSFGAATIAYVACVVDVAESLDRRQTELRAVRVGDRQARREHLDEGPAPEDRVRRVEQRRGRSARCQRDVDRREQHAVDQHRVCRLSVQLLREVPGDGRAEAELLDQELHLGFEVVRIVHRVPTLALGQRDEAGAHVTAPLGDRVVPDHPDVVATLDERACDPQCRHEVPRAVPGHDQVATHVSPAPRLRLLDKL